MYPEDNLDEATEIREAIAKYEDGADTKMQTIIKAANDFAELLEVRAILYLLPGRLIGPYLKAIQIPVERG